MSVDLLPKTTTAPLTEDPIDRDELEALVEALIEEARQRTRRRRRRYVATLLVVLVALVGLLRLSHGRVHGVSTAGGSVRPLATARLPKNGKIAFVQDGFLKVSNPDGFGSRVLAGVRVKAGPAGPCAWPCEIGAPAWSPSGKQLAFLRGDGGSGPGCVSNCRHPDLSLFAIGSKGLGERRLAPCGNPCGSYPIGSFYWSPNGRKIVLPSVGLTLVDTRTGSIRRLSATGENPSWSPDGSRIAYTFAGSLFVVPVAGVGHGRRLAASDDTAPSWSPNGQTLVFGASDAIYTIGADGSGLRRLLAGPIASGPGVPAWSPNGKRILYFSTPGTPAHYTPEVWSMSPTGADRERLYRGSCCVGTWTRPIWSPDGAKVAFAWNADAIVMNADGSHQRTLARFASDLAWQPVR